MAFYIHASLYEVKTNLSAFVRALERGFTDYVVIKRYGRNVAFLRPFTENKSPAQDIENESDRRMWNRARYLEDGGRTSRRCKE